VEGGAVRKATEAEVEAARDWFGRFKRRWEHYAAYTPAEIRRMGYGEWEGDV